MVLEKIWKKRDSFDGTNFLAWVTTIVKNSYIDITRRPEFKCKFYDISSVYNLVSDSNTLVSHKYLVEVIKGIVKDNFNDQYNIIFNMRYIEGYKFSEIEDITGIDSLTARGSIHRIVKFLKNDKKLIQILEQ